MIFVANKRRVILIDRGARIRYLRLNVRYVREERLNPSFEWVQLKRVSEKYLEGVRQRKNACARAEESLKADLQLCILRVICLR